MRGRCSDGSRQPWAIRACSRALPRWPTAGLRALAGLGLTGRRVDTLVDLASAVADGTLALDPGADRIEARRLLRAIPGIGPWTADYVALRALGDPDAWPGTDLVLARRVRADGLDPARWRPWRGYAAMYLWTDTSKEPG